MVCQPLMPTQASSHEHSSRRRTSTDLMEENVIHVSSSDESDLDAGGRSQVRSPPWPQASKLSIITFAYMRPILRKGHRQFKDGHHLTQEDLFDVPDYMKSRRLVKLFRNLCQQGDQPSLIMVLWRLAWPIFGPAGLAQFFVVIFKVSIPCSLQQLLRVLEDHVGGQQIFKGGFPYAFTIFLASLGVAFCQHREADLSNRAGIILRSALVSNIYEHAMGLTPRGREGLTTGEVTNLVATDTQKLYEVALEGHLLWSCPLYIILVTSILWTLMGPTILLGILVLILFVPLVQMIVARMLVFRRKRTGLIDLRINVITSMLQGIRVTKLNHYEDKMERRIAAIRKDETTLLRQELRLWGWVMVMPVISPLLATAVALSSFVLVSEKNILTPSKAFTALFLFGILRFPINQTARLVGKVAQACDAAQRIADFLERPTRSSCRKISQRRETASSLLGTDHVLKMQNGSFAVGSSACNREAIQGGENEIDATSGGDNFTMHDVSLCVDRSQVTAVVGAVGAGKSLLLQAILGELDGLPGTDLALAGRVSYACQVPFILNATFRENVLFGSPFDEEQYNAVLEACCLLPDIAQLGPAGDLTEIGERGVTLSGGQKQRVSLARAAYAQPDVALLDDVFSALDPKTAASVFEALLGNESGLLRASTGTVLVTHATSVLDKVDSLVVLSRGRVEFSGTWTEWNASETTANTAIEAFRDAIDSEPIIKTEASRHELSNVSVLEKGSQEVDVDQFDGTIMAAEEREFGLSSWKIWKVWLFHAGGRTFLILQILFLVIDRGMNVASDWWISRWASASTHPVHEFGVTFRPQSEGRSAQMVFLLINFGFIFTSAFGAALRSHWAFAGGERCAESLFSLMVERLLKSPLSYFETTPIGRIINRFTYDVEVLDVELIVSLTGVTITLSWFIASVIVMVTVLPWIILALIPIVGVYISIQLYYRRTGPDLQRLDALSRSPLQASLAEGLDGAVTIRAFGKERYFIRKFQETVDRNSAAMLNFVSAQRWLGLRIEILGACITFMACLMVVVANHSLQIPPSLVGLLIVWSVNLSIVLGFMVQRFSESEARITAIERICQIMELPQEASFETDPSFALDPAWPSKGVLVFEDVCLRYRPELPLSLDSVSFRLEPGTRCGVVGRTGAGKTSLTAALFRLVELESGRILLDGIDLSKIGLADVRGRTGGMTIIPQDPVLFAGTLRDCLDPFGTYRDKDDQKLWDALLAVQHRDAIRGERTRDEVLNDKVDEGGCNFSVGERQLLCLARALVEEPRLLVLDEATGSTDGATDAELQRMLRSRFRNTTMLTIAHRLDTIIDYDVVLVMDKGQAVEFGPPKELLEKPGAFFANLVEAAGSENKVQLLRRLDSAVLIRREDSTEENKTFEP